jgi:hypothetical protein
MRLFDRGMGQWDLRASDEDRERVVELLREHCAAGRLTVDEFSARIDEVYASRTYRELAWTTRELPRLEPRSPYSGLGIGWHALGNGLFASIWIALSADPYGPSVLDAPVPLLTMLGSAGFIGARAWLQRRRAERLGGRRHRYEVFARDRWHPGVQPPRWLPPPGRRTLAARGRPPAQYQPGRAPRGRPHPDYGQGYGPGYGQRRP